MRTRIPASGRVGTAPRIPEFVDSSASLSPKTQFGDMLVDTKTLLNLFL